MRKRPGPAPTPKRIYAEQLCKKHRKGGGDYISDHGLSKILYAKWKKDFPNLGAANIMIRTVRGHAGAQNRKWTGDKTYYTDPNYNKGYIEASVSKEYKDASKRKLVKSKYYIVTWAQNNTSVHPDL